MKGYFKILLPVVLVLAMVAVACAPPTPAAPTEAPAAKKKVAVLFPGVVTDESWNELGYNGLLKAQEGCNVEIAYSEDVLQDEQIEAFRTYAAQGYDIIIGHGGEYEDSANTVAAEYPKTEFVVVNGMAGHDNVSAYTLSYSHMGYLAGWLACETSKSGKIALVYGEPIPISEQAAESFKLAAETCAKELGKTVDVKVVATGNWADVAKARELALALIADGVDVLWHILDAADAGVFSAAEDKGVYAIGLYVDQSYLGEKAWVGSALGLPTTLIYEPACGHVPPGQLSYMTVSTPNGVDLALSDKVSKDVQEKLKGIVEKMRSGEINVKP